ncbi:MAG: DUF4080 domain-containing protein [Candidatus Thiodiazotropha sp. DIVDIV]
MDRKLSQNIDTENQPKVALVGLHAGYSHSSLALQSIAAYADSWSCPHQMQLFETMVNTNHQALIENLVDYEPQILGFSTYLWNIAASIRLIRLIKQLLPDVWILFGGPEAGARGTELLSAITELDFVIEGEGEEAFSDLMKVLLHREGAYEEISGLVFRDQGVIQQNPIRLLPVEKIPATLSNGLFEGGKSLVYWETSRGCPYQCTFCTSATDRLRAFPMERVEADLKVLEQLSNKTIKLLDRSFHLGKQRTTELLKRFAETPPGLRFHLELNPDRISEQAMTIFSQADAGKFQFEIGLQTLDDDVLTRIDRRMDVAKALENIRQLIEMRRHPVHLDLIVGLPGENSIQCASSLDQTFKLSPDHLQLGILKLLPGTPLHTQARQLGYRWDREPPYEVLSNPTLGFKEIAQFKRYAELLERLYNSGLMRNTLTGLVASSFSGRLSLCFDRLLEVSGQGLARDNLQPDSLFGYMCSFIEPYVEKSPNLEEWLLWDYCQFSLVNGKTPRWIADRLVENDQFNVQGSRRRLPVLGLTAEAASLINSQSGQGFVAGRYALWPRQHKKGKPVEIIQIDT